MKSFKRAVGLLALSSLASSVASLKLTFPDGQHQAEKPVPQFSPAEFEDLNLSANHSHEEFEDLDLFARKKRSVFRNTIEKDLKRFSGPGQAPERTTSLAPAAAGSPFRIVLDYSMMDVKLSRTHANYVKNSLMPAVVDYFTSALRLKYPYKGKITSPNWSDLDEACDGGIPRSYVTQGVEGDLVIIVRLSTNKEEGYVARAASCVFDNKTGRTLLSSINFNTEYIEVDEKNPLVHAKNIYTSFHELTHVLGFSDGLYENFLLPNGRPNKNVVIKTATQTLINVEPLTTRLRQHYVCDKIQGAPLENEGGDGSAGAHFERRIFFNEMMTASEVHDGKLSEFTLALLEGTGWFIVDYSKAEPFYAGKGDGCDYFFGSCKNARTVATFEEFCPKEGAKLCSPSYNGMAFCSTQDQFADGCKMPEVAFEYDCRNKAAKKYANSLTDLQVFGPTGNSKCFVGDLGVSRANNAEDAYCFSYKCNGTSSLDVIIGKSVAKCTRKGKMEVVGFKGGIVCPDPFTFCSQSEESFCPRGCMGRGTCEDGQCKCQQGFTGVDCAFKA